MSDEVETVFWESDGKHWKLSKLKFGSVKFPRKGFETTLNSKANVQSLWKKHFRRFCKFLSHEVETISRKSETKRSNLFNKIFGHRKLRENDFEGILSSKSNDLSFWKQHFPVFCKVFDDKVETIFGGSEGKRSKLFKSKFDHSKVFRKNVLKLFWAQKQMF